mmetsp:Transcript_119317/g.337521  ORF Transcript_119317/g.337521 Transcript_119317/m.337521 type:complete len:945 (+) Transcript_119317:91-2925(+)
MTNHGSLLRLFRSECFDAHLHMHYLHRMEQSGVQDYLVNELYKMTDDDVDFYLPQLCQLALLRFSKSSLHRFLLDKAAQSMHFALKIHWLVQGVVEDRTPDLWESALEMANLCETAVVNSIGRGGGDAAPSGAPSSSRGGGDGDAHPDWSRSMSDLQRSSSSPELSRALHEEAEAMCENGDVAASASTAEPQPEEVAMLTASARRAWSEETVPTSAAVGADAAEEEGAGDSVAEAGAIECDGEMEPAAAGTQAPTVRPPFDAETMAETLPSPLAGGASAAASRRPLSAFARRRSASNRLQHDPHSLDRWACSRRLVAMTRERTPEELALSLGCPASLPNSYAELGEPSGASGLASSGEEFGLGKDMRQFLMKRRRCDYFNTQNHLVSLLMKLSAALVGIAERSERTDALRSCLAVVNRWLFDRRIFMCLEGQLGLLGLQIPMLTSRDSRQQLLRLHVAQCRVFSSATRAPYLLVLELADLEDVGAASELRHRENSRDTMPHASTTHSPSKTGSKDACQPEPVDGPRHTGAVEMLARCIDLEIDAAASSGDSEQGRRSPLSTNGEDVPEQVSHVETLRRRLAAISADVWVDTSLGTAPDAGSPQAPIAKHCARCPHQDVWRDVEELAADSGAFSTTDLPPRCAQCPAMRRAEQAQRTRLAIWGEAWEDRKRRIRKASPFGKYPSWALEAVLVKGADDLRQELLVSQIISQFSRIFRDANLPLWLRRMEVLVTSSDSGLIECIHDAVSVDALKKLYPGKTLAEVFKVAFADRLFEAKRNFIESSAAYSLVVWFLQVKDRHNGNLMIDSSGHVIHIDFGFLLSNSPGGNMAFEQAPFKLTQEFLDIMDGECSDEYEYFRTLLIRGFLESRRHMERVLLPVRMTAAGSKMPCFREGVDSVLQSLQDRFFMSLTEEACIDKIMELIDTSVNNWRTIQYDNYQRIVNGIY